MMRTSMEAVDVRSRIVERTLDTAGRIVDACVVRQRNSTATFLYGTQRMGMAVVTSHTPCIS